jgi:uncharacterized protein YjbI with pentapeptide repeats
MKLGICQYTFQSFKLSFSCKKQSISDSNFCLFHDEGYSKKKENETKLVEELKKKIEECLPPKDLECVGYNLPPIIFSEFLKDGTFAQKVYFNGAKFSKKADFSKVKFLDDVYFSGAVFSTEAEFSETEFMKNADFSDVEFKELAYFSGTKFQNNTKFKNKADFSDAIFSKEVFFSRSVFSQEVSFYGATFSELANFFAIDFCDKSDFSHSRFLGELAFQGSM